MKKRFTIILLLLSLLAGCAAEQDSKTNCPCTTTAKDCYLCGDSMNKQIPTHWGQNNIALISLNTFEMMPLEINTYDLLSGEQIEEYAQAVSLCSGGSKEGGFTASLMLDCNRGFATGSVNFRGDERPDVNKAASFLCKDCLNEILSEKNGKFFGVGVINLETKEIRLFDESLRGFGLGDFYIACDLIDSEDSDFHRMDVLIFYCPVRYPKEP